jgi:hypothetical protein
MEQNKRCLTIGDHIKNMKQYVWNNNEQECKTCGGKLDENSENGLCLPCGVVEMYFRPCLGGCGILIQRTPPLSRNFCRNCERKI